MNLTNKQQRYLRRLAHNIKPVVWLGQHGLSDNVLTEIESALDHHELIKIKLRLGNHALKDKTIDEICEKTEAVFVQRIGNILSIYRRNNEQPVITLAMD